MSPFRNGKLKQPFFRFQKNNSTNVLNKDISVNVIKVESEFQINSMEAPVAKISNGISSVENVITENKRRRSISRSRSKTDIHNASIGNRSSTTTPARSIKNGYIPGKTPKKTFPGKEQTLSNISRNASQRDHLENLNASYFKGSSNQPLPKKPDSSTKLSYTDDPIAASIISKAEERQIKNQLLASSILSDAVERDNACKNEARSEKERQQNCIQNMMKTFGIDATTNAFNGCCNDTDVILNGSKKSKSESRMSIDSCSFSEDSSGHSSGSVGSSISVRNEKELLAHSRYCETRIKELEEDLSKKAESVQTLKDRVSDRELEISILQKRLSLRTHSAQNSNPTATTATNTPPSKSVKSQDCDECKRKEKVIDQLYNKLEVLENAVESFVNGSPTLPKTPKHGSSSTSKGTMGTSPTSSLDLIMKNINELNNLITETRKDVEYVAANTAQFQKHDVVSLTFFKDGFKVDNNRFRSYEEPLSQNFMKDLADGFYPAEMQGDYPEGVSFLVNDQRFKLFGDTVTHSERIAFTGKGRQLESRPSSSASPSVTSLSPFKKSLFPPLGSSSVSTPEDTRPPSQSSASKLNVSKKMNDIKNNSTTTNRNKGQLEPIKASPLKTVSSSSNFDKHSSQNKGTMKTPSKQAPFKRIIASNGGGLKKGATQTISKKKDVCQLKIHGIEDSPFLLDLVSYDTVKTLRGVLSNLVKTNRISKFLKQNHVKSKDVKTGGDEKPTMEPIFQLYFGLPKQRLSDDSKTLADLGLSPNGVLHMSRR